MTHKSLTRMTELRQLVYRVLEADKPTAAASWLRWTIAALIITNIIAVIAESHAEFYSDHRISLETLNIISVIIFTIEYLARLWSAVEDPKFADVSGRQARWAYMTSLYGGFDLAAIAPFYLGFIIPYDLRQLRALRLLRLLKLHRSFRSLDVFYSVLRSQSPNLFGATLVILILLVFSSSLMYAVESNSNVVEIQNTSQSASPAQKDPFSNISKAMWWSVVTLTSVGYGDVIPRTNTGRIIGSFIMLLGVGLVALPAAILAGAFADELRVRRENVTRQALRQLKDGEIDAQERVELMARGLQEGFSEEQVNKIAESAEETLHPAQACPKCGYALGNRNKGELV